MTGGAAGRLPFPHAIARASASRDVRSRRDLTDRADRPKPRCASRRTTERCAGAVGCRADRRRDLMAAPTGDRARSETSRQQNSPDQKLSRPAPALGSYGIRIIRVHRAQGSLPRFALTRHAPRSAPTTLDAAPRQIGEHGVQLDSVRCARHSRISGRRLGVHSYMVSPCSNPMGALHRSLATQAASAITAGGTSIVWGCQIIDLPALHLTI